MNEENPWIDATLDGCPKNDPKSAPRRKLLEEAAHSLPPGWYHPDNQLPALPPSLESPMAGRKRLNLVGLVTIAVASLLLWTLIFSPSAQHRLRGISLSDAIVRDIAEHRYSAPLPAFYPIDDRGTPDWLEADIALRIPPKRQTLCFGEPNQKSPDLRWQALWTSDPEDPALFAERVRSVESYRLEQRGATLAEAARIAPGNAYYELLVVISLANEALEKDYVSSGKATRTITERSAFEEAIERLDRVLEGGPFESHAKTMIEARLSDWLPPDEFPDFARDAVWWYQIQPTTRAFPPSASALGSLFAAKADEIAKSGSPEEMKDWCTKWRRMMSLVSSSNAGIQAHILPYQIANLSHEAMADASAAHGVDQEERFFKDFKTVKRHFRVWSWSIADTSSTLTRGVGTLGLDPRPGRLAEHRMFESLYLTWTVVLMFSLVATLSLLLFAAESRLLGLSARLSKLLRPSDYGRIVLTGLVAPLLVVALTFEIPFLHPRETIFAEDHALSVLLKLAALVTAIVLLTLREISRCLSRRAWPLGFAPMASLPLLLMAITALACPLAASFLMQESSLPSEATEWMWIGFFSMLGFEILLSIVAIAILLYRGPRRIQTAVVLRSAIPLFTCGALLISAYVAVDCRIEKHHVTQAQPERIDSPAFLQAMIDGPPDGRVNQKLIIDYLESAP